LISTISAAKPKIAEYPFTTLEPNLGIVRYRDYDGFTVADLPGLIEGAHTGKGLGIQFLKHVERTRVLLILIESLSEDYLRDLDVLRNELASYSKELSKKPWFVAISKIDTADDETRQRIAVLKDAMDVLVHSFSSVSGEGISELKDQMWKLIEEQSAAEIKETG
jgi:GTP-binding protein